MTERPTDPRTIQQQEQQHAERNRSALQRALQHARHEAQHETPKPSRELADTGSGTSYRKLHSLSFPFPAHACLSLVSRLSRRSGTGFTPSADFPVVTWSAC